MSITFNRIKITSVKILTLHKTSEFYFELKNRKIINQFLSSIYHAHHQPPLLLVYFFVLLFINLPIYHSTMQLLSVHHYGIWSSIDNSVFFINCDLNFFIITFISLQCFSWSDDRSYWGCWITNILKHL